MENSCYENSFTELNLLNLLDYSDRRKVEVSQKEKRKIKKLQYEHTFVDSSDGRILQQSLPACTEVMVFEDGDSVFELTTAEVYDCWCRLHACSRIE
jgi:hypothetical protein